MDTGIIDGAKEFGFLPYLLTVVLCAVGFYIWKMTWRLFDAQDKHETVRTAVVERQAASLDRIGDAVVEVGRTGLAIDQKLTATHDQLAAIAIMHRRHDRVIRLLLEMAREVAPPDKPRVVQLIEDAKRILEE